MNFSMLNKVGRLQRVSACVAAFTLVACGQNPGSKTGAEFAAESAVDQEFGALTEDDTLPEEQGTAAATDGLESQEGMPVEDGNEGLPADLPANTKAVYALRLAWGNFPANRALAGQPVNYSGTISVSSGALLKARGFRLERRVQGDGIVRPREDKAILDLASTITVAADGVHLLVAADTDDATLQVTLGGKDGAPIQYEETFTLSGLKELQKSVPSATANQEVRVSLHRVRKQQIEGCHSGTLIGRWVKKDGAKRDLNTAGGFLLDSSGAKVGKFFAVAGKNKDGAPVMFVKLIARGKFVARGKGSYDAEAKTFSVELWKGGAQVGTLTGAYTDRSSETGIGEVTGSYSAGQCTAE